MVFEWPYDPLPGNRCPTLEPGDIVTVDNLGSHKGKVIRQAIRHRRRQALLPGQVLPGPKPDRNVLRQAEALTARKAARRTVDAVYNAIAHILPLTTPAECANYFAQAGYGSPTRIPLQ